MNVFKVFVFIFGFFVLNITTGGMCYGQVISTLSGTGSGGSGGYSGDGGPASAATMSGPSSITKDKNGNLYFTDWLNNRIRKIATDGTITLYAGNGSSGDAGDGGPATAAALTRPFCVTADTVGNLYIADEIGNKIRKVSATGTITTIAGTDTGGYRGDGGPATNCRLNGPTGLAYSSRTGNLYISDYGNHRIRKVDTSGIITTIAGTGTHGYSGDGGAAVSAKLYFPYRIIVDTAENLFFTEQTNNVVRKVNASGIISTLAGSGIAGSSGDGGPATAAYFNNPIGICMDKYGSIYVADEYNQSIRMITPSGTISRVAGVGIAGYSGDGGPATAAKIYGPFDIYVDTAGYMFIADANNNRLRVVNTCLLRTVGSISAADSVCTGTSLTLSDTTAGGRWSSSDTSLASIGASTGTCTLASAGVATVTYTATNSCGYSIATHRFQIDSTPRVGAIAGVDTLCVGVPVTFTDTPSTGAWSSSNTSVVTISAGGIATAITNGVDTLLYSVSNACGAVRASHSVFVLSAPHVSAISGRTSVCPGDTLALTDSATAGRWMSSDTAILAVGVGSGIVRAVSSGTAVVTLSLSNYCGSASATHAVVVVPRTPNPGVIMGDTSLCVGASTTLIDTVTRGAWGLVTSGIATITPAGVVTGIAAGRAEVSFTDTNMCGTADTTFFITINPLPFAGTISGADSLCPGDTISLSATVTGGSWQSTNAGLATVNGAGQVTGVANGLVTIRYRKSNSCGADTATHTVYVKSATECTSGVSLISASVFRIYPNPNGGAFHISAPMLGSQEATVVITNVFGVKVGEQTIMGSHDNEIKLNVPSGIYFATITSNGGIYQSRVVIAR